MYRNFGANRSRFGQNRNSDFHNDRDRNRRNWQDNRPRNDENDSDSEYRNTHNFSHIDRNENFSGNSRFHNSTNSDNHTISESQGEENHFSTPSINNNGPDDTNSSFNQQFQNILGQSIPLQVHAASNHQNHQYHGLQQPNIPISPCKNNTSSINQRINFLRL